MATLWTQTYTGRAFDLLNPQPDQVCDVDLAVHLSRQPRYAGATRDFMSVGEHTLRAHMTLAERADRGEVEPLAPAYGLVHDDHEFVLCDDTVPKREALIALAQELFGPEIAEKIGVVLQVQRDRISEAVHQAAGLPWPPPASIKAAIKRVDYELLATERRDQMTVPPARWEIDSKGIQPLEGRIVPFSMKEAEVLWLRAARAVLPGFKQWKA